MKCFLVLLQSESPHVAGNNAPSYSIFPAWKRKHTSEIIFCWQPSKILMWRKGGVPWSLEHLHSKVIKGVLCFFRLMHLEFKKFRENHEKYVMSVSIHFVVEIFHSFCTYTLTKSLPLVRTFDKTYIKRVTSTRALKGANGTMNGQ